MKKGFTLIEIVVAIGIFGIFIVIITGIFGRFVGVERHSIAQGQLVVDVQSALEAFIKEARTAYGTTYFVNSTGDAIAFRNQSRECVVYRLRESSAETGGRGIFERAASTEGVTCEPEAISDSRFTPITGNSTDITDLRFQVDVADVVDEKLRNQGIISIEMTVESTQGNISPITIKNSVTSRQMSPYHHL